MDAILRTLSKNEYNILKPLYNDFIKDTSGQSPFSHKDKSFEKKMDEIYKYNHIILTAFVEDKPIGYIIGTERTKNWGHLAQLFVLKDYRRLHVADRLVSKLMLWFKNNSLSFISVNVISQNETALSFYRKNGFIEEFTMMRHKSSKGQPIPS